MEEAEKSNDMDLAFGNGRAFEGGWGWDEFSFAIEPTLCYEAVYLLQLCLGVLREAIGCDGRFEFLEALGIIMTVQLAEGFANIASYALFVGGLKSAKGGGD